MYENITYAMLVNRMLEQALSIDSNLDTREGSLVWLGIAPAAVELQNLYLELDTVLDETFADTASREMLIRRAAERGLTPYPATAAVLELSVTPVDLQLEIGTRFSIGALNYAVSKSLGDGKYEITCETPGEAGNDYGDAVIPIEYVEGLESCTVTALLIPGEDEEDTEVFRQRYFDSLDAQAFAGNQADYIEKVNAIPGVGGVKVYRAWNGDIRPAELVPPDGVSAWMETVEASEEIKSWLNKVYEAGQDGKLTVGGTVRLVIIDSTFSSPSAALVELVQAAIDPTQNAGEGIGLAPIGHVVKVEGVKSKTLGISFALTYQDGWDWEDVQGYVRDTIQGYFEELAATWAQQEQALVVRISQIESRLLEVNGVLDIGDTKINGLAENYVLGADDIPVLGDITPSTSGQSA